MTTAIGIVVILAGLICWIGQILSFFVPSVAAKVGVCELEEEMDPFSHVIMHPCFSAVDIKVSLYNYN
jgi:hypothetical protein